MKIKEIEIISELVKYRSYASAAEGLLCSPSVISKYVANIEKELDIKLFVRSNKVSELMLTPEGKVLINALQSINSTHQRLIELTKQLKGNYENTMRIGSQPRYGNIHEQKIVASLIYNNPKVMIDMVKMESRDLMSLLVSGRLDAIFVTIHGDIVVEEYYKEQLSSSDAEIIFITCEKG